MRKMVEIEPGTVFGTYTVLDVLPKVKNKPRQWNCRCECGKIYARALGNLKVRKFNGGPTCRSCRALRQRSENALMLILFRAVKQRAKRRKVAFSLQFWQFSELASKPCAYCGTAPALRCTRAGVPSDRLLLYNGLDRIDSKFGYTPGNVAPCCKWCNFTKLDSSLEEFQARIVKMYNHLPAEVVLCQAA